MNKTEQAVAIFNKYAESYQQKYMNVDLYADTFDLFCNNITKEKARVLELACGPGNITQYLLQIRPDLKILATDLAPNMIEIAKRNNPTASFEIMDSKSIGSLHQKFDAIMCGFCIPYLSKKEAIQLIKDAYTILNTGGVFYISTMEDDYGKSGIEKSSNGDEIYIHYHEAGYLSEAMLAEGFNIISLQRKDYLQASGAITKDLIIISLK